MSVITMETANRIKVSAVFSFQPSSFCCQRCGQKTAGIRDECLLLLRVFLVLFPLAKQIAALTAFV
jgi:hypothetical protein